MLQNGGKIGLALGSGAARGLAHIGVLKVLEREGIPIGAISGTSIGALIGALYAAGLSAERLEDVARNVDWRRLARLVDPILPTSGLIDGRKVAQFIAHILPAHSFEELKVPFAVVATDINSGEPLVIRRGDLLCALRAAIAFPGIFTPVRFGSRFLVDGGLLNPVPSDVARGLGAEAVIGVCAIPEIQKNPTETYLPPRKSIFDRSALFDRFTSGRVEGLARHLLSNAEPPDPEMDKKPPGILRVFAQSVSIMENQINSLRLERDGIDVLLRPDLAGITLLEFHRANEAIRAGEIATEKALNRIRALASPDCSSACM